MFKTYFKITFRNLTKHKKYSLINILSLSIGLAGFILIMLWVQDELSYDTFHKNSDNIYVVLRKDQDKLSGATAQPLATALKNDLPEVVEATSIALLPQSLNPYIQYEDKGFDENVAFTDPRFFNIFSFNFKEGNPKSVFEDPNSIIMTEKMCKKYFGNKSAYGQMLTMTFLGQERQMRVTGILKDMPHNSHFQRGFFVSLNFIKSFGINWDSWANQAPQTYIMTQGQINVPLLEQNIFECKSKYYKEESVSYSLLPLTKIHLHSNHVEFFSSTGDIKYIYIFSTVAAIILLIACINYMNLSNALSLKRTKEIGIKKVVGARWNNLILQHLGETAILAFLALICALIIVECLLPVLNQLSGKSFIINYMDPQFLVTSLLATLATCLISGLYPALFITKFQPIQVLKQKFQNRTNGFNLQKTLIIFQFALSTVIIICTMVVTRQLHYIRDVNLGYNKENIICLKAKGDISNNYNAFKNKLMANPDIINITRSEPFGTQSLGKTEGVNWAGKKRKFQTWMLHIDWDFATTYKLEMLQGRFYSAEHPSDRTDAYVLNEAAINEMGLDDPIGKEITVWRRQGTIIGIVKNFHFNSLHHLIEPLVFRMPPENEESVYFRELSIRIKPNSIRESVAFLESAWTSYYPDEPFDYYFLDEQLNANYLLEQRMGDIFKYFSLLAILIACLGLYGLTTFMIERRIKDIGIHKVLGAKMSNIVTLISKQYVQWILIANAISWPLAWIAMHKWLQNFAYRVNISWWVFALAGSLVLTIALATVSWQVIKAAKVNPVKSLRYE